MNVDHMCRICLGSVNLFPIFNFKRHTENITRFEDLSLKIRDCSNVEIFENDGLPDKICKDCESLLMSAHRFKTLSLESDQKIRNSLHTQVIIEYSFQDATVEKVPKKTVEYESLDHIIQMKKEAVDVKEDVEIFEISYYNDNYSVLSQKYNNLKNILSQQNENKKFNTDELTMKDSLNVANINSHQMRKNDFQKKSDVGQHTLEIHEKKILYHCHGCETLFKSDLDRAAHEKSCEMTKEVSFKFRKCLKTSNDTEPHVKEQCDARDVDKESYHCDKCQKSFTKRQSLKVHQFLHSGIKKFVCEVCGYSFARQDYLAKHLRAHLLDRPYACSFLECKYASSQRTSLVQHMRTHTKEKPFRCKECNYSSATSGNLFQHVRARHRERELFKCEVCCLIFKRKDTLKEHVTVMHCGIKPICEHCDVAFNTRSSLHKHLRCKHKI